MGKDPSQFSSQASERELADKMKLGMRQWTTGVAVLTARDEAGEPHAMTVSSFTSVSDAPPSLLVCVNKNARLANILNNQSQSFTLSLLTSEHEAVANVCAKSDMHDQRFNIGNWSPDAGPRLADAAAIFDCDVMNIVPYGTHLVVIGNIVDAHISSAENSPLCYWNGSYRRIVPQST